MRKLNIVMMVLCLVLAAFFIALFIYGLVMLREFDPAMLMYVAGAALTARVFRRRANVAGSIPASGVK